MACIRLLLGCSYCCNHDYTWLASTGSSKNSKAQVYFRNCYAAKEAGVLISTQKTKVMLNNANTQTPPLLRRGFDLLEEVKELKYFGGLIQYDGSLLIPKDVELVKHAIHSARLAQTNT